MVLSEDENHIKMNFMILSKREETEKHIIADHSKLAVKLNKLKLNRQDDFTTNSRLQEESAVLNHKNSILSTKINNYIFESNKVQREIVVMECKIDEFKTSRRQATVVNDKENLTMSLLFKRMDLHKNKLNEIWENETDVDNIKNLVEMKKSLEAKKTQLRSNILQLQVKISERKNLIPKFNEEIMILKKRNAAYLKRMTRKLEYLEHSLTEKKKTFINTDIHEYLKK
uniref:Uncharacterized protein n=2 Tax=Rhodnius prolixus TaxID=13249 RepID=T1I765_RHOPR